MSPIITSNHWKSLVDFLSRWGINVHVLTKMQEKIVNFADRFSTPLSLPLSNQLPFLFSCHHLHAGAGKMGFSASPQNGLWHRNTCSQIFHDDLMKKVERQRHISIHDLVLASPIHAPDGLEFCLILFSWVWFPTQSHPLWDLNMKELPLHSVPPWD